MNLTTYLLDAGWFPAAKEILDEWMAAHRGRGLCLEPSDVMQALAAQKRPQVLDHYGCSARGVRILAEARPAAVASTLSRLASDQDEMDSMVIEGTVKAKKAGAIPPS